jgi:signal transduction histidine kinase
MAIEDDGIGFDSQKAGKVKPDGHGLGLVGMIERANLLHGSVKIDSSPCEGTIVTVNVPWA